MIAALTLSGAAASAELVLRLAARRKSFAERKAEIEALLSDVIRHRAFFESALDRDIAAFAALVDTQRQAKILQPDDPDRAAELLQGAYVHAAEAPLELSRRALDFMHDVEQGLEYASRFTVSDVGSAAVLARGGIDAALLTVEANLSYIDDIRARPLRAELTRIRPEAERISERVWSRSTELINGVTGGS